MPNSSIKNEDLYEKLRGEGNSKEKAARVSNAVARDGASRVGKRGGDSPAYESWSKSDLYQRAKEVSIDGRSRMSKADLIDALRNH